MTDSTSVQPLGECVVCGKLCSKGCSSCQEVGLDWMYFCSIDHQKLIWRVHKHVCGKNPFEWPPLSAEEAKEAWNLRNTLVNIHPEETWKEHIVRVTKEAAPKLGIPSNLVVRQTADETFKELLESMRNPTPSERRAGTLHSHRSLKFAAKLNSVTEARGLLPLMVKEPFDCMSSLLSGCLAELPRGLKFSSTLHHRVAVFVGIIVHYVEAYLKKGYHFDVKKHPFISHAASVLRSLDGDALSNGNQIQARQSIRKAISSVLTATSL
ncbi:hypothetical protein JCM3765_001944 [Sporobolomyces pararoseus]